MIETENLIRKFGDLTAERSGNEGHLLVADVNPTGMGKVSERLLYIDNLRLMVIAFVVMHHLAVTYSGFGSWYYVEGTHQDTLH